MCRFRTSAAVLACFFCRATVSWNVRRLRPSATVCWFMMSLDRLDVLGQVSWISKGLPKPLIFFTISNYKSIDSGSGGSRGTFSFPGAADLNNSIADCARSPFSRSTVSQTVRVDFAPLRPFRPFVCLRVWFVCRATVSWNVRVDFAPL